MATAKSKKPSVRLWTPPVRLSYPYLVTPDTGRENSDGKFKTDGFITKASFKESGKPLQEAVLSVGKDFFGSKFSLKGEFRTPFKDTDKDEKIVNEVQKNCILIRAKSSRQPMFLAARKINGVWPPVTPQFIANIKGGDWAKLEVTVYPYTQQGGGITLGLNCLQFWKEGEGFGQGVSKLLETAEELEAEIDDASDVDVTEDDDDSIV